ncbi:MAG: HEAT repeat domain-containing protein [Planctomycetota bacterium]|nr:HEAT repeat domain-containing protein [Planctomycetota bacterium]
MQEEEVEVSFCDLCGTSVPAADIASGAAIVRHGKWIGRCCLADLRGSAAAAASGGAAPSAAAASDGAAAKAAPQGGQADGSRTATFAVVLLVAMIGGVIFLEGRLAGFEAATTAALEQAALSQQEHGQQLSGLDVAVGDKAEQADVAALQQQCQALLTQLTAAAERDAQRQAVLDQEIDGLRRAVRAAEDRIIDYRPLFDDLRERHSRAIAVLEGMRDRAPAASVAAAPAPPQPVATPAASGGGAGLPPALAAAAAKLGASDPAVRFEAVDVLIESKSLDVLKHLLPLANDPDAFVRRLTVEGLREFRAAAAVDALLQSLADEDENVCDTAWRSLRDLTGQKFPFDAAATKKARAGAASKWREWWAKARDSFGA